MYRGGTNLPPTVCCSSRTKGNLSTHTKTATVPGLPSLGFVPFLRGRETSLLDAQQWSLVWGGLLPRKFLPESRVFFFFLNDLFDVYRLLRFVVSLKSRVFLLFFLHGSVIFWQHELPV